MATYDRDYPGSDLTIVQLLNALNRKLENTTRFSIRANFNVNQLDDLEIGAARAHAGIRAFNNAFNPVNQLNPDTLAIVFQYLADDCFFDNMIDRNPEKKLHSYKWISLTHVCSYWRHVSMALPQLWCTVDSRCPTLALLSIDRSREASLRVTIHPGCSEGLAAKLEALMCRVQILDIRLPYEEHLRFRDHLTTLSPRLQSLSIMLPCRSDPKTQLTPSLMSSFMPALTRLEVSGFCLVDSPLRFTNLIHLELMYSSSNPPMGCILDMLESNPGLVQLSIVETTTMANDIDEGRVVSLPHLRNLCIDGFETKRLLRHFSLPPGSHLCVKNHFTATDTQEGHMLERTLPNSYTRFQNMNNITKLGLTADTDISCDVDGVGVHGGFTISMTEDSRINFTLPFITFESLAPLSLVHITELWMTDNVFPDSFFEATDHPMRCFVQMVQLKRIVAIRCSTKVLLQTLTHPATPPICAKLDSLVLSNCTFDRSLLIKASQYRNENQCPLRQIDIICRPGMVGLNIDYISDLRRCVGKVQLLVDDESLEWDAPSSVPY